MYEPLERKRVPIGRCEKNINQFADQPQLLPAASSQTRDRPLPESIMLDSQDARKPGRTQCPHNSSLAAAVLAALPPSRFPAGMRGQTTQSRRSIIPSPTAFTAVTSRDARLWPRSNPTPHGLGNEDADCSRSLSTDPGCLKAPAFPAPPTPLARRAGTIDDHTVTDHSATDHRQQRRRCALLERPASGITDNVTIAYAIGLTPTRINPADPEGLR